MPTDTGHQLERDDMGGVWRRIKLAWIAFFSILFKGTLPASVSALAGRDTVPQVDRPAAPDGARQLLALLQRDGRLIDFVMEDLAAYGDAQIGAAARDVHAGCRRILDRYFTLATVLDGREGDPITIDSAIDPAAIHLVGNVTAGPPFRGTLLHRGWRVEQVSLPPLADEAGRAIAAPAEIEVA